jgi:hypothetical protein
MVSPVPYVAIVAAALVALGIHALSLALPRVRIEPTLRGTTARGGVLTLVLHNPGRWAARRVRVSVAWASVRDETSQVDALDVGDIAAKDAVVVEVRDLQRGLDVAKTWDALVIEARAKNALPARARVAVAPSATRGRPPDAPRAAVEYLRPDRACAAAADGAHRWREERVESDGVVERWQVCRACGFVRRLPLTAAEVETQRRARAERSAREQRELEEELRRAEAAEAPRRTARPRGGSDGDRLPRQVALWILGIEQEDPDDATVEAAYRRLAKEVHPDRAGLDPKARAVLEERMRDVNRARDRLRE